MNEQPYADPSKPTTPDLTSREKLTKQIEDLQIQTSRCIAADDAKGAVISLQQTQVLLMALLVDELQATQQMFERVDKRVAALPQAIRAQEPSRVEVKVEPGGLRVLLSEEQLAAYKTFRAVLQACSESTNSLVAAGTQLLLPVVNEWDRNFLKSEQ